MSQKTYIFLILFASLCCIAATVRLDPSTYTVTIKYEDDARCLGGILGKNVVISAPECFGNRIGDEFNFTSVKVVVGSIEVPIVRVSLPKIPMRNGEVFSDYAFAFLKEDLNLTQNGLTALEIPTNMMKTVGSWGSVSTDDGNGPRKYRIVDFENCPSRDDVNFIEKNILCVKLSNPDDRCLNKRGAPMVIRRSNGKIYIIGLYLGCYMDSPYEIFTNIYFKSEKSAANANINPSKYTVTFKYNNATSRCHGGILGENILISAVECFGKRSGEAFNFTSIKAVVGSVEVEVNQVRLPKFPPEKGTVLRDYALVWLKENLNLKQNGLTTLALPSRKMSVGSWGLVGKNNGTKLRQYEIVQSENCLNNVDVNFIATSHLCVKLPNPNDRCLDQLGRPLVVQRNDGLEVIGIYLDCYDDLPHEVFANIYGGIGKRSEVLPPHSYL